MPYAGSRPKSLSDQTLGDIVSDASIPLARPNDTVGYVAYLVLMTGIGRIPIVDSASGQLCGLVARKDLLRLRRLIAESGTERQPYFGSRKDLPRAQV